MWNAFLNVPLILKRVLFEHTLSCLLKTTERTGNMPAWGCRCKKESLILGIVFEFSKYALWTRTFFKLNIESILGYRLICPHSCVPSLALKWLVWSWRRTSISSVCLSCRRLWDTVRRLGNYFFYTLYYFFSLFEYHSVNCFPSLSTLLFLLFYFCILEQQRWRGLQRIKNQVFGKSK